MTWACSYHGKRGLFRDLVILDGKHQKMKTSGHIILNYVLVFVSQLMKIMETAVRLADKIRHHSVNTATLMTL
jgi:hypothetical protein